MTQQTKHAQIQELITDGEIYLGAANKTAHYDKDSGTVEVNMEGLYRVLYASVDDFKAHMLEDTPTPYKVSLLIGERDMDSGDITFNSAYTPGVTLIDESEDGSSVYSTFADAYPDLRDYRLIIEMAGNDFNGEMNFGAVVLTNGMLAYPLDITDTTGGITEPRTDTNVGTYQLECKFEDDLTELESAFESDPMFNMDLDLGIILANDQFVGQINLASGMDEKEANINIGRIRAMTLVNIHDESFKRPVTHSTKW